MCIRDSVISEVPYQLNKKDFVEKIAGLVVDKIIVGVSDIRDESSSEGAVSYTHLDVYKRQLL